MSTPTTAEEVALRLHRWATRRLGMPVSSVPDPGELAQMCRGQGLKAVEFLITRVTSAAEADQLRSNISLRGGVERLLDEYGLSEETGKGKESRPPKRAGKGKGKGTGKVNDKDEPDTATTVSELAMRAATLRASIAAATAACERAMQDSGSLCDRLEPLSRTAMQSRRAACDSLAMRLIHRAGSQLVAGEAGKAGGFMARVRDCADEIDRISGDTSITATTTTSTITATTAAPEVFFQVPGGDAGELETGDERALRQVCESHAARMPRPLAASGPASVSASTAMSSTSSASSSSSSSSSSSVSESTTGTAKKHAFHPVADRALLRAVREVTAGPDRFVAALVTLTARETARVRAEARKVDPARDAELLGFRYDESTGEWVDVSGGENEGENGNGNGNDAGSFAAEKTTLAQIRALRDRHSAAFQRTAALRGEKEDLQHRLSIAVGKADARDVAAMRLGETANPDEAGDPDILEHVRVLQRLQADLAGETAAVAEARRIADELESERSERLRDLSVIESSRERLLTERSNARRAQSEIQGLISANLESRRSLNERCDAFARWVRRRIDPLKGRVALLAETIGKERRAECRAAATVPPAALDYIDVGYATSTSGGGGVHNSYNNIINNNNNNSGSNGTIDNGMPVRRVDTVRERCAVPDAGLALIKRSLGLPPNAGHADLLAAAEALVGGAAALECAAEWSRRAWDDGSHVAGGSADERPHAVVERLSALRHEQVHQIAPQLEDACESTSHALHRCAHVREISADWWSQPAQYAAPWVEVDGRNMGGHAARWRALGAELTAARRR